MNNNDYDPFSQFFYWCFSLESIFVKENFYLIMRLGLSLSNIFEIWKVLLTGEKVVWIRWRENVDMICIQRSTESDATLSSWGSMNLHWCLVGSFLGIGRLLLVLDWLLNLRCLFRSVSNLEVRLVLLIGWIIIYVLLTGLVVGCGWSPQANEKLLAPPGP